MVLKLYQTILSHSYNTTTATFPLILIPSSAASLPALCNDRTEGMIAAEGLPLPLHYIPLRSAA